MIWFKFAMKKNFTEPACGISLAAFAIQSNWRISDGLTKKKMLICCMQTDTAKKLANCDSEMSPIICGFVICGLIIKVCMPLNVWQEEQTLNNTICVQNVAQCPEHFPYFGNSFFRHNILVKGEEQRRTKLFIMGKKASILHLCTVPTSLSFFSLPFCRYVSLFIALFFLFIV